MYCGDPSELAKAFEALTALTLFFVVVADGRLASFLTASLQKPPKVSTTNGMNVAF